ncbi:hypothetical protein H0H81_002422 [Sphagnurus paluster]|uniref:Uncharacterized protein n=1 Tax=Sphagnurus paluster TaxID=117069 RepID=A0A9P7KEZ8_9AGAR|nr:hypothetical protein H0H81_002422 [Sphagnurus paluster]
MSSSAAPTVDPAAVPTTLAGFFNKLDVTFAVLQDDIARGSNPEDIENSLQVLEDGIGAIKEKGWPVRLRGAWKEEGVVRDALKQVVLGAQRSGSYPVLAAGMSDSERLQYLCDRENG